MPIVVIAPILRMLRVSLAVAVLLLLLGCSGQHHRTLWVPPADPLKAAADWDVASATCDAKALATQLSEAEKSRLYRSAPDIDKHDEDGAEVQEGIAAVLMFLYAYRVAVAEENKKQRVFVDCMQYLGWQKQPGALSVLARPSEDIEKP